jgi:hypothetical protein
VSFFCFTQAGKECTVVFFTRFAFHYWHSSLASGNFTTAHAFPLLHPEQLTLQHTPGLQRRWCGRSVVSQSSISCIFTPLTSSHTRCDNISLQWHILWVSSKKLFVLRVITLCCRFSQMAQLIGQRSHVDYYVVLCRTS